MQNQTDRRFADIAKTSPALLAWWKKFKALAPHLADRVANTEVLIGDESPLSEKCPSPAAVANELNTAWFSTATPSETLFRRLLTMCLWDLTHSRHDRVTMLFIDRLIDEAVTSGDKQMLRFAEKTATAVSREGTAGLAQIGIHVRPPVAIPVRE